MLLNMTRSNIRKGLEGPQHSPSSWQQPEPALQFHMTVCCYTSNTLSVYLSKKEHFIKQKKQKKNKKTWFP